MTVYELARELGNALLETEEGKRRNDARYVFDGDKAAQVQLFAYSNYKAAVQERYNNDQISDEELEAEQAKLNEMMEELKKNDIIMDMLNAETAFSAVVDQTMSILNSTLTGQSEGGCGGCCSTCGGCH